MPENSQLLFETYKLHAELADRLSSEREGLNKLHSGLVTSIIAASILLHRFAPDEKTIWIFVFSILGIFISISWALALYSMTGKMNAKHNVLVRLEQHLPFTFFEQENLLFEKEGYLRRKYSVLLMPFAFLIFSLFWTLLLVLEKLYFS